MTALILSFKTGCAGVEGTSSRRSLALFVLLLAACSAFFAPLPVLAQIGLTNGVAYMQNFDGLGTGNVTTTNLGSHHNSLAGWWFHETGSGANATMTAGNGSSATGDSYNFGATGGGNRKLGALLSGTVQSRYGAMFTNASAVAITNLSIAYTGVTWRIGAANRADRLDFQYSLNATWVGDTAAAWVDVDALDYTNDPVATAPQSGSELQSRFVSNVIAGLNIAPGNRIWIRWVDFDASGADDGTGIDGFVLVPIGVSAAPDIEVRGNDTAIADGDTTPSYADHTDFGSVGLVGATLTRMFTVTNPGTAALTLQNVAIGGPQAADFTVIAQPSLNIAAGGSTTFQIQFDPSATGVRTATIYITNNVIGKTPYDFVIQGTGVAAGIALSPSTVAITTMVGSTPGSPGFTVTNVGLGQLVYSVSTNAEWLSVSPVGGTLYPNVGQNHTVTFNVSGLSGGTSNATITVSDANASNSPQTVAVSLVLTNIPDPTAQTATIDGRELIRLAWAKQPAHDVLIAYRQGSAPGVPLNGTAYSVGASLPGGGTVICKGAASTLEHVVRTNAAHFYAFYSINNDHYSPGVSASATTLSYGDGEIVEPFAYTNGVSLSGLNGGNGWSGAWSVGAGAWTVETANAFVSFPPMPDYPTGVANKITANLTSSAEWRARRDFAAVSTGRLYVAAMIAIQYGGSGKYTGIRILSNGVERMFFGETGGNNIFGIDGWGGGVQNSSFNINPLESNTNNTYLISGRYDFSTRDFRIKAYYRTSSVPGTEPADASWDTSVTLAAGRANSLDGIEIVTGGFSGGHPGRVFFDEIRVAQAWNELLRLVATPDISILGTNGATITTANTPAGANGTDFGATPVAGGFVDRTFVITNVGNAALSITGVTTSGAHAADFLVLAPTSYPVSVPAGSRTNLTVRFDPSASGTRTATVAVASNDGDTPNYEFYVSGTGGAPTVTTTIANPTNFTTAVSGGNVTDDGFLPVTNRGVVWATTSGPTVPGAQTTNGAGTGSFTATLTNLTPGITYYYRAFAQNVAGTSYGTEYLLTTPCLTSGPTVLAASGIGYTNFTANWQALDGATGYRLDVATSAAFVVSATVTNFTETMGTTGANGDSIATHESNNRFDNVAFTMSGSGDMRNTSASSGYTGASGGFNVMLNAAGENFIIAGIDSSGLANMRVMFGIRKSTTSEDGSSISLDASTNGTDWVSCGTISLPTGTGTATWHHRTNSVPASMVGTNMRLRFQTSSATVEFRIDDVVLIGDVSVPSFVPGFSNLFVSGTSRLVTGLSENVTYYYRVRAAGGGSCVSPNSGTQTVTTLAYNPPGIGVGGDQSASSTVGGAATLNFTVTNVGQRLLFYQITNSAPSWLVISPTSGVSIAESNTQAHTITLWATNLAAGVYTGRVVVFNTGTGPNTATNSPRTFDVVFTVDAIAPVISAGVTNDGNEMIRVSWTKPSGFDVMILHRETNAPVAPANGMAYNVGDTLSLGTRVIYKGPAANLDHVVRPGSTNHYAFYSIYSNYYSAVVSASASVGVYQPGEIVDVFAYTSGVTAVSLRGGVGWGTNFWSGDTNRFSISNLSFAAIADYPTPRANKLAVSPDDGETLGISRQLNTPISNGRIYVGYIVNFQYPGLGKYVGVQLMSNTTERLFAGEVSTADLRLGIDGTSSTRVMTNGIGHDYVVIVRYDWAADQAVASAFKLGTDTVPADEPTSWDITISKASNLVGQINAVRLVAGTTGSGTPGATYFDELRVATNWYQLVQAVPPVGGPIIYDGFAASAGTLHGGSGGTGWTNNWVLGGDPYADYVANSFSVSNSCYPTPTGHKVVLYGDVNGRTVLATRAFATPFTNGTVYFSWIQNYQYNGTDKFAGLRLMDGTAEKAFIGKVANANQALGISGSTADSNSTYNLQHGTGNDYVIIGKYDFSTRELSATAYKIGSDAIAEEPSGYWKVTTTQDVGHISSISGVRLAIGAASSVQIGYVYYDEIRVGTNWYEVVRRDGPSQAPAMAQGPVPRLLYVGTNYVPSLNPQGASNDITVTDADLANTTDPLDIAVLWSNQFGVFLTNANGSLNIGSRAGRVNPNFDPVVLASTGTQFQSLGLDAAFTNWVGFNGATVVTTFQRQAFSITNSSFDDAYYITLSAENNNLGGGVTNAPNGADPIPLWRALTVNTALQFHVKDDDPNPPEIFEFTIDGVGGSGSSNLLPGTIALIGLNGAPSTLQERFSFVVLAPFPAGTRFLFTDCGWDADSNNWYNLNEFHTNTWVASGNMDVGTVVELTITNINNAGDQIVIYQYTGTASPTTDPANITFLYALNLGPGWFTNLAYPGGGTNNQNSMLYRGLTNGVNAVSVPIPLGSANARYIGPTTGTASYLLSQISNSNNWQAFASGDLIITNYSFNVLGAGDFDWNTPELSDAQVLAGGYRVTNVVRDLDSGIIATNKPFGHAPYFMLFNTNGGVMVSNVFSVNFADGTKTPVTNAMSAPAGVYDEIVLGTVSGLTAVADFDNDRVGDTLFRTSRVSVLVYDDDPDAPVVGSGGVALMIGDAAIAPTNRTELIAGWNFNNAAVRDAVSHGSGAMANTITTTNSFTGTALNAYETDPAGDDFAVQGTANIGRSIGFVIDMTGRKDLVVSFAARRSSTGYNSNLVQVADGTNAFVTVNANWSPALDTWGTHTFDLSSYTNLNGAASVTFRIVFGTNAVTGAGNNRFDNFQFNAGYLSYYEVTDGALASVGATNPLRFSFNAYDGYSGLARGTADDGTNMAVTIGGLATNNTANYQASLSSASSTGAASTSVWQFASMT